MCATLNSLECQLDESSSSSLAKYKSVYYRVATWRTEKHVNNSQERGRDQVAKWRFEKTEKGVKHGVSDTDNPIPIAYVLRHFFSFFQRQPTQTVTIAATPTNPAGYSHLFRNSTSARRDTQNPYKYNISSLFSTSVSHGKLSKSSAQCSLLQITTNSPGKNRGERVATPCITGVKSRVARSIFAHFQGIHWLFANKSESKRSRTSQKPLQKTCPVV